MQKALWILSMLSLAGGVLLAAVWLTETVPALQGYVALPIDSTDVPYGPLPVAVGLFVAALVVHPGLRDRKDKRR